MTGPMTDEELEDWGYEYIDTVDDWDAFDREKHAPELTDQQWEWLREFFEEV